MTGGDYSVKRFRGKWWSPGKYRSHVYMLPAKENAGHQAGV